MHSHMPNGLYVQYGCHHHAPSGWRNFDVSPTLRFERIPLLGRLYNKNAERFPPNVEYGDIVKGLPIAHESCDGVYCSHVLEHLSLNDFHRALHNTYIVLRPGGTFRLVMPDLESCVRAYVEDAAASAAENFMRSAGIGIEERPQRFMGRLMAAFGNSQHLWLWDFKAAKAALEAAGFRNVRRATYGDAQDQRFKEVEQAGRWEDCLGIECAK